MLNLTSLTRGALGVKGERLEPPPFLEKESVLLLASNEPTRESVVS
jgi:hypothetical protein